MTGFGSFDNSTCKRVLDLLEPGDLKLGQVVIKRVAVVKLGVNNGSGDGGGCFVIEVCTKPEVHNLLQSSQRRTEGSEPLPCTENLVTFGPVVPEMCLRIVIHR